MAEEKRYYWIKLKTDFFDLETIDWLKSQENGCEYIVLYQQLCLMTANKDGEMASRIGEMIVPYDAKKIARDTKTDIDTVMVALKLFTQIGLIYMQDNGVLRIPAVAEMVGSESEWAEKKRKQRNKKEEIVGDNVPGLSSNCPGNCPTEIDIRDREKILDIDKDKDKETECSSSSSMGNLESITSSLFSIWGMTASQKDIEKVFELIKTDDGAGIDANKRDLLEYAFGQAERKGQQAMNWNYVNGVLENLDKKGIHDLNTLKVREYYRQTTKGR